ncbi:unnamed protein product, partial [Eruca vesicaria subsp. sativa]|nr:unnamed protein product [Eruca vesicaria subsp. sativa]
KRETPTENRFISSLCDCCFLTSKTSWNGRLFLFICGSSSPSSTSICGENRRGSATCARKN